MPDHERSDYPDTYTDRINELIEAKKKQERVPARGADTGRQQRDRPGASAAGQPGSSQEAACRQDSS
jgi:hypothetical protein